MNELHRVDQVAYVRFASVYRSFKDIDEFMHELEDLIRLRKETGAAPLVPAARQEGRARLPQGRARFVGAVPVPTASSADLRFMRKALALARRMLGRTSPNPLSDV